MIERLSSAPKKVVPFAPTSKDDATSDGDPTERSGQAIVALLKEAADITNETCDRAMDTAHQLSIKLRAVEDRVKELEAEARQYQVRATQAEKWLLRIHQEIEDKFFGPKGVSVPQAPSQRSQ
jgi:DNA repair ATPase RecN